ncbi:MAG: CocE/NonD family hydrolase, partial [Acidobacteriota bacterium]
VNDFLRTEGTTPMKFLEDHPLFDDFWAEKAAKVEEIDLPMLVCASFSDHGLHTVGSFRAFSRAKSAQKWVYTHRYGKWDAYYSDEVQQLTLDFMNCFLKDDTSSGFLDRPPVRLEIRSNRDTVHEVRHEQAWPPADVRPKKLYLDSGSPALSTAPVAEPAEVTYSSQDGSATFRHQFQTPTEVVGVMSLCLNVEVRSAPGEARPADDMTLFAVAEKLDRDGQPVRFYGSVGERNDVLSKGYLRVSLRALDEARSTPAQPELRLDTVEKLSPGQIVPVTIAFFPHATFFGAGESLHIEVAGRDLVPHPVYKKISIDGAAVHVIHVGGDRASYLQIPAIESHSLR